MMKFALLLITGSMLVASATDRDDKLEALEMHIRTFNTTLPATAIDTGVITQKNIASVGIILEEVIIPEETRHFAQNLLNRFEQSDDNLRAVASLVVLRTILPQRPHGMHITFTQAILDCNECTNCQNDTPCDHQKYTLTWTMRIGQSNPQKLDFSKPLSGRTGWPEADYLAKALSQFTAQQKAGLQDISHFAVSPYAHPNIKEAALDSLYFQLGITAILLGKCAHDMPVVYNSDLLPAGTETLTVSQLAHRIVSSIHDTTHAQADMGLGESIT